MIAAGKNIRRRNRLADFACIVFIFALSAAYFNPFWLKGKVFVPADVLYNQSPWLFSKTDFAEARNPELSDAIQQHYPWRLFYQRSIRAGEVPLWNPHQFCGQPFAANDQSAVYYPFNLIFYLLLAAPAAYTVSAWFHLWLGGLFMFLLLRYWRAGRAGAFLAAAVFMFNGCNTVWMEHAAKQAAMTWAPLVMLLGCVLLRKRNMISLVAFAASIAALLTAGFLQYASYALFAFVLFFIYHIVFIERGAGRGRAAAVAAAGLLLAFALAAVHIIPVFELASRSYRAIIQTHNGWFAGLPLRYIMNIISPEAYGSPVAGTFDPAVNYTEKTFFIPAIALAMCIVAARGIIFEGLLKSNERRAAAFWLLLWMFAAAAMLGTPAYCAYYYLVPGAKTMVVSRIGYLFTFSSAVLAGIGIAVLQKRLISFKADGTSAKHGLIVWVIVATSVIAWTLYTALPWSMKFNTFTDKRLLYAKTPATDFLQKERKVKSRIYSGDNEWMLFPDDATALELDDVRGYDSLYPAAYRAFMREIQTHWGLTPLERAASVAEAPSVQVATTLDWLNVRYIVSRENFDVPWYVPALKDNVSVYKNLRAYPRAFFCDGYRVIRDDKETLKTVTSPEFAPEKMLVINNEPRFPILKTNDSLTPGMIPGRYSVYRWTNAEIILDVNLARNKLLFISDTYYPGWLATLNGEPVQILRANHTFRAVPVPAGRSRLRMWFAPSSALLGLSISLAAIALSLVAAAAVVGSAIKRKRY